MRRALRVLLRGLAGLAALIAVLGGLFGYFVYAPAPEVPHLSGVLSHGAIAAGGRERSYLLYVPRGLAKGAPLVVMMHGSGENGARARIDTGYAFDRLADEHGFAVVYPDGYEGYWNGCNIVGDYSANTLNIDDVGFLTALAGKLASETGIDPGRVFAAGISRGGSMAMRLTLEAPGRFRAVAVVSESVPAPDNFKCRPERGGTSSVMLMNGTEDLLVPFDGGEVSLFGLFIKRGMVLSSRASGQYLAGLNAITAAPETREVEAAGGVRIEHVLWRNGAKVEVELVAVHGGGHGLPQPYFRYPRLLGPTVSDPNGAALIWDFFARQTQEGAK